MSSNAPTGLAWNVWAEPYSQRPTFRPLEWVERGRDISVVVDLAALRYSDEKGVHYEGVSDSFYDWLRKFPDKSVDLDILIIPDDKYFSPQRAAERVKSIHIDLDRLRSYGGRALSKTPFQLLRENPDNVDFSFGRISFRLHTKDVIGTGSVAFSIWANGMIPVEEIYAPICIGDGAATACDERGPTNYTLKGPDAFRVAVQQMAGKVYPYAALQFIELDSNVVGVYRCNGCPDWEENEYETWTLDRSASYLSDYLKTTILGTFENAAKFADMATFRTAGDALFNTLFRNGTKAQRRFAAMVDNVVDNDGMEPKTIFVRLLPTNPDPLFMVPLGLMSVPVPDGGQQYVGFHFRVESPLEAQDYSTTASCISQWSLLVPPENIKIINPELANARTGFEDWIKSYKEWEAMQR